MSWLLDTNVISEVRRPSPEPKVIRWLNEVDEDRVYLSVATIAELRRGIALLGDGRRRESLATWLDEELPGRFADRVLSIDGRIANRGGISWPTAGGAVLRCR
ncbi:toxin FitB [Variibacter gotjawalensis]|uniref:Toxin FitB n=1 Tax=Variibacter gotjawalensis TaxID=1333996 RepID=A0A0S3PQH3_9BRAD|nr:putative nucleic acid-binding protein [Variibacter gotjawalensis]BAT58200.1 toxin FitB [Variibacter gotjawalensis]